MSEIEHEHEHEHEIEGEMIDDRYSTVQLRSTTC